MRSPKTVQTYQKKNNLSQIYWRGSLTYFSLILVFPSHMKWLSSSAVSTSAPEWIQKSWRQGRHVFFWEGTIWLWVWFSDQHPEGERGNVYTKQRKYAPCSLNPTLWCGCCFPSLLMKTSWHSGSSCFDSWVVTGLRSKRGNWHTGQAPLCYFVGIWQTKH